MILLAFLLAGISGFLGATLLSTRRALRRQQRALAHEEALRQEVQRRVVSTLENMGDAYHLVDADERFAYVNPAARRLFTSQGIDPDALLGKPIWDEFPDLVGTFAESEMRRVMRDRVTSAFEFFYPPWKRWFSVRIFPGNDAGVAVHLTDTTDVHSLQEDLRESAEQLKLAVEAANLTAYEWDIKTGLVRRLGEVPPDAPLGKEYSLAELVETIHPADQPSMLARLEATLRGETDVYISEHRSNENPEREWCWARVRGRLIRAPDGTPLSMIGVAMDITEHKRLEEALREADQRKDNFLATLAHELRNPLAPIRNSLELLKDEGPVTRRMSRSRDVIERQVLQMARLLDDLLDVSRISRNTLELRPEPIALCEVIERALETSHPLITARGHELVCELPSTEVQLTADPVRLAQVFSNLLNNAARYTDDGGRITVRAKRDGNEVVVAVSDTGIGFDEAGLSGLFEMFARGHAATQRSGDGLGIGLSLARSLVTLHGGTLDASSSGAGRGSTFTVRLPLRAPDTSSPEDPAPMEPTASKRPWRLVIADDLHDNTDSLADLLRLLGHEVRTAYDGEQAVAAVAEFKPEAVLLDIGMPKLDGYEACRRIRATEGEELIIVALTGWGQSIDRERTKAAGFTQHLVKPVDHVTLLKVLDELRKA